MQSIKTALLTFTLCAILAVLGAVIGIFAASGINDLRVSSISVSWKLLDSSNKFLDIVGATPTSVWAKSSDGKQYAWECQNQNECKWTETEETPPNTNEEYWSTISGQTCPIEDTLSKKRVAGNVTECVVTQFSIGEYSQTDYYALLDNGTIWYGYYGVDGYYLVYFTLISIPIGALLGIITGVIIMYRKVKSSKSKN